MVLTCVRHVVEERERVERAVGPRTPVAHTRKPPGTNHCHRSSQHWRPSTTLSTRRIVMKIAEVPYAADAEVSLSYDELQVRLCSFFRARIA